MIFEGHSPSPKVYQQFAPEKLQRNPTGKDRNKGNGNISRDLGRKKKKGRNFPFLSHRIPMYGIFTYM